MFWRCTKVLWVSNLHFWVNYLFKKDTNSSTFVVLILHVCLFFEASTLREFSFLCEVCFQVNLFFNYFCHLYKYSESQVTVIYIVIFTMQMYSLFKHTFCKNCSNFIIEMILSFSKPTFITTIKFFTIPTPNVKPQFVQHSSCVHFPHARLCKCWQSSHTEHTRKM